MFENTKLVYKKMIHDIDLAIHIVDIIVQVLFLGYYSYCAVTSFNDYPILFYFYISLATLSVIWLFFTIFRYKFEKNKKKKIGRIIKLIKWIIRAVVIGINIFLMIRYGTTDLKIMLIILSITFLFGQIAFEIICEFVKHYYDLIIYSLMLDTEEMVDTLPKGVKIADKVFKTGIMDKLKDFANKHKANHEKEDDLNKIKSDKK